MDFDTRMKIVTFLVTGSGAVMLMTANYGDRPNIATDAQNFVKSGWKWMLTPSKKEIEEINRRQEREKQPRDKM